MSSLADSQIPPPSDWSAFERLCADLIESETGNTNTALHGRGGQRQKGVDIFSHYGEVKLGVQCKGKKTWPPKKITTKEIDAEIKEAEKYEPKLTEFKVATTAENDVHIQDYLATLNEQRSKKNKFKVTIYFWDEISRKITLHENVVKKHYPHLTLDTAQIGEALGTSEIINEQLKKHLERILKSRFFREFDTPKETEIFLHKILQGEYRTSSNSLKEKCLCWCARLLSTSNQQKSIEILSVIKSGIDKEYYRIAKAFSEATPDNYESAQLDISKSNSKSAVSASYFIISHNKGAEAGFQWLKHCGHTFSKLKSDAKVFFILKCFEVNKWNKAYKKLTKLKESDFEEAPFLNILNALCTLQKIIPKEAKKEILDGVPFAAKTFPLSTSAKNIKFLQDAINLFNTASFVAENLDLADTANLMSDYRLWLAIRNPKTQDVGLKELGDSLDDEETAIRRAPLAIQYNLDVDLEKLEQAVDKLTARTMGRSGEAAIARLALSQTKETDLEYFEYLEKHLEQISLCVDPKILKSTQVHALVNSGDFEKASKLLTDLAREGLEESIVKHLESLINDQASDGPLSALRDAFTKDDSLLSLTKLMAALRSKERWVEYKKYAKEYHSRVQSDSSMEELLEAHNQLNEFRHIHDILRHENVYIEQSVNIKKIWCLCLYHVGEIKEARVQLEELKQVLSDSFTREISFNIALCSGDWAGLNQLIEDEWANKEKSSANDLLRAAFLANLIGSARFKDLLFSSVENANSDPEILAKAYFLATKYGIESEEIFQWLQEAKNNSGKHGPIVNVSIEELIKKQRSWTSTENNFFQMLNASQVPMFFGKEVINESLTQQFLVRAISNKRQVDPRKRGLVYAFSPNSVSALNLPKIISLDITSLLTLSILDLLEEVTDSFDTVYIAHQTLYWLFMELDNIKFHQPSKISDSERLLELIGKSQISILEHSGPINLDLSELVGQELASFLSHAEKKSSDGSRKHYVIKPGPVKRVSLLSDTEVDLKEYSNLLCSCAALINKLRSNGSLTLTEAKTALEYLNPREKIWPNEPQIEDGSIVYIDNVGASYLQHLGLLEKIAEAGLKPYISPAIFTEAKNLSHYSGLMDGIENKIEEIRKILQEKIEDGKVKLAPLEQKNKRISEEIGGHPAEDLSSLSEVSDAIIIDDRFMNQHPHYETNGNIKPIYTSLDLINELERLGKIKLEEKFEFLTQLRRSSFVFVPVEINEIMHYLKSSQANAHKFKETAELKALRESIQLICSRKTLQPANEFQWLIDLSYKIAECLSNIWASNVKLDQAIAQCNWLFYGLLNLNGWESSVPKETSHDNIGGLLMLILNQLIITSHKTNSKYREDYLSWVEENIADKIKENFPERYEQCIQETIRLFDEMSKR